jgi:hypothetical protein
MSENTDPVPPVRTETSGSTAMAVAADTCQKSRRPTEPEPRGTVHPRPGGPLQVVLPSTGLDFMAASPESLPTRAEVDPVNARIEAKARALGATFSHVNGSNQAIYVFADSDAGDREEISISRDFPMSDNNVEYVERQFLDYAALQGEYDGR